MFFGNTRGRGNTNLILIAAPHGSVDREQGVSKSGNPPLRTTMRTLPSLTRSLVVVRQLSLPLDSQKLNGLSSAQRTIVIARLANVLMAAAGVATEEESCDDER
ncbi:hypothetical protein NKH86_24495 [Mesorhizobium sp. M0913]|uniref:hypothetical protein n=1 Tax=Mesorhizobium sp. M0913 TaxID=2957026 RepID=UPI003339205A